MNKLKEIIFGSSNIVFFGGAGTSTESSIPDFRSESGIYKTKNGYAYPPEVMLSHSFFMSHPEDFYEFYKAKMIYKDARPNPAHLALTELERRGKLKVVVTQNIDGLHQSAGTKNVLEIHGSVHRNYCMDCGERYDLAYVINSPGIIPLCGKCNGIVRPDVVLYEEQLEEGILDRAVSYIARAEAFIVGGTSLVVYPAANLIHYYQGGRLILINKMETPYDGKANLVIHDSIGKVLEDAIRDS